MPKSPSKGSDTIGVNCCEICEVTKECYQHLNAGGKEPEKRLCACEYDYPDQYREALKNE
jgi:hypothetical protein